MNIWEAFESGYGPPWVRAATALDADFLKKVPLACHIGRRAVSLMEAAAPLYKALTTDEEGGEEYENDPDVYRAFFAVLVAQLRLEYYG